MRRGGADGGVAAAIVPLEQIDERTDAGQPARELRVGVAVAGCVWRSAEICCPRVIEDVSPVLGDDRVATRTGVALGMERAQREGRVDAAGHERTVDEPTFRERG